MDIVATGLSLIALGFVADHVRRIGRLEASLGDAAPVVEDPRNVRVRRGILAILALGGVALAIGVARTVLGT